MLIFIVPALLLCDCLPSRHSPVSQAAEAGHAPKVRLEATSRATLSIVPLDTLLGYAVDAEQAKTT